MIGTVKLINSKKTRAGVWIDGFGFSVLLGEELPLEIGHQVSGGLRNLGEETLQNLSTKEIFDVFIDDFDQDQHEIRNSVSRS
jgi:hypothetical protein